MSSSANLSEDVVAEGEVDAVGHFQTVQLALSDVGQAAPDQRHLPAQDAQRVQGYECTVSAAGSSMSGLSSALQLTRHLHHGILFKLPEHAPHDAGLPLSGSQPSMPSVDREWMRCICTLNELIRA